MPQGTGIAFEPCIGPTLPPRGIATGIGPKPGWDRKLDRVGTSLAAQPGAATTAGSGIAGYPFASPRMMSKKR